MEPIWITRPEDAAADTHAAFFASFELDRASVAELRLLSPGPSLVYLNGEIVLEGPLRYGPGHPEYAWTTLDLPAGRHRLAIHAVHEGLVTRIMPLEKPLLACQVIVEDKPLPLDWRCAPLPGYSPRVRRINPQLGWIEWCDSRQNPAGWVRNGLPEGKPPHRSEPLEHILRTRIQPVRRTNRRLKPIAQGPVAEKFGYERDDPATRFFLRDLRCDDLPAEGVWRRYDLGRVRLGRPRFMLDLPAGSVVEIAMSESLEHGRVSPWITLSDGASCNLDHYVARGGVETFMPIAARGGRFVEIHVLAPSAPKILAEEFQERHYHGEPVGAFQSDDRLLNRIWATGVETHRACAEDSMIDNPTRERGQWTGDIASVGLEVASVAYSDIGLIRRGLVQSAQCARGDGLVAGLCPGGSAHLSSYAAQWVTACLRYWELTGDRTVLTELFEAAERNIGAFLASATDAGVSRDLGWAFIDWGYVPNEGPSDMALNLHFVVTLRDMVRWAFALGKTERVRFYHDQADRFERICRQWLSRTLTEPNGYERLGMHRAVLALRAGLLSKAEGTTGIRLIQDHYRKCFPNNPKGRRLSSPSVSATDLITPYFSHFALAELWELGEGDFVLDQFRTCWGWGLKGGRTTWVEVFEPRFSHCHGWSACPTWQLSRYVLGLRPRFDLGEGVFDFLPRTHSLRRAKGRVPLPFQEGHIQIEFEKGERETRWRVESPRSVLLRTDREDIPVDGRVEFTRPT